MRDPQFAKGDFVIARSGGPLLRVEDVFPDKERTGYDVACKLARPRQPHDTWAGGGGTFHESYLIRAADPERQEGGE